MSDTRADYLPMHESFLWQARRPVFAEKEAENFLAGWAARGYLVLGASPDVAAHGDPHFLTGRPRQQPLPAPADYWQRQAELHERLRGNGLLHMPLALGPDAAAPHALAWLVPAPARGQLRVIGGFEEEVPLDDAQRQGWLLALAKRLLGASIGVGQRALVQPPTAGAGPAYWHYGAYLGDFAVPGDTHAARLRLLLAGLPRYAAHADAPGVPATPAEAADWPLLVNPGVSGVADGHRRVNGHCELLFGAQQRPGNTRLNDIWW